jgi:hypothetical protein
MREEDERKDARGKEQPERKKIEKMKGKKEMGWARKEEKKERKKKKKKKRIGLLTWSKPNPIGPSPSPI